MKTLCMIMLLTCVACGTASMEDDPNVNAGPDAGPVEERPDADIAPPPCSSTCDGCCDGDTCLSGSSGGACGSNGETCSDCGVHGLCESSGVNTCEIDPSSKWNIVAVRAVIPVVKENGDDWDFGGGAPDTFAIAYFNDDEIGRTATSDNTFTPEWNEIVAEEVRADRMKDSNIQLLDKDFANDDNIGRCPVPLLSYDAFVSGQEQHINCNDASGYQMVLRIEPN